MFDLPYSGITRQEVEDLSVEDIYNKMHRNLNAKNKIGFEHRCNNMFHPEKYH